MERSLEELQIALAELKEKYPDWSNTIDKIQDYVDYKKFKDAELKLKRLKADAAEMPQGIKATDLLAKVSEVQRYLNDYKNAYAQYEASLNRHENKMIGHDVTS